MFKEKPFNVIIFCSIVTLCTAVLQYINPDLSFIDGGLVTAIVLTLLIKEDQYTYIFGAIGFLLVIMASFYPSDFLSRQQLIMQHLFSGIIVIMAVLAVLYVKKLYRSIESDERQVNALFEHATEGMILTNAKGEIILINPAALALFNYTLEELLRKQVETLIPMRFHSAHTHYREDFYRSPSNRSMGHNRELYAKTKEGREFPVEVSLSFYREKNEFFVVAFVVNITERKRAEKELLDQKNQLEQITLDVRKLNAELETKVEQRTLILREALQELEKSQEELSEALDKEKELSEIKSRFVSMASHEFRTPLSTVLSSASLISKYTNSDEQEKRDKHIRRIKDSVKHLNDLLEDFLSLGKLEEGRISTEVAMFNVHNFLEEVIDEIRSILKEGQEIHSAYEGEPVFVSDKRMLKNILINLLSNASKFSPEGAAIWVTMKNSGVELCTMIKDKGIGIANDDKEHLFTSFYRAKNAVNIQGTGLGLHIVKRYIELLSGTIHLESALGQGTEVTILVPALPLRDQGF